MSNEFNRVPRRFIVGCPSYADFSDWISQAVQWMVTDLEQNGTLAEVAA
ncbi:hypothetical protein [Paraburkholderia sartisoli]|uniref:Uncharacterized protein n=1 Tax=Paraburkholderia sartisoli TaxID=83784 RepID=A0A1H4DYD4_9BURK|nr:hypothetical protein [Paraburkholderia sartisoli]SEA77350.1 hypothetical protein SAMN05192564_1035 [Paraburkholderia sartisoli]